MAAEADEAAQESIALGGSFFTHYLISALRGAADANGDQRVTLAEARAYATQHTTRATGAWARAVQHPVYHFDIEGHGEIVLTDLREGAARLAFGKDLDGHLVVTEKGSPLVVAESRKRAGRPLRLALPKGRYVAYLRTAKAVKIAEVRLPWGGQATLTCADMTPRSYQSVARKGSRLVVHRHRLRVGGGLQSGILTGMGALGVVRLGYGLNLAPVELGLRFTFSQKTFAAVDTEIDAQVLGGAVLVAYERALSIVDLRGWLVGEGQFWRQVVRRQGERRSGVFGVGFGAGVRVPIVWHLFGEGAVEAMVYFPDEEGSGRIVRPTVAGDLAVGLVF